MKTTIEKFFGKKGFTLIELIVAIFIFSLVTVSIVAVFVSMAGAYQKARAIKTMKENMEYALNSIAKDVRMGRIEPDYANGSLQPRLVVSRNRGGKACYEVGLDYLGKDDTSGDCTGTIKKIVDLSGTAMTFDAASSGFYSLTTDPPAAPTRRGWAEMNFSIKMTAGREMEADQINVQTIVSSRDYGWEEVN